MSVFTAAARDTTTSTRLVFANPNLRRLNLALAGSMIGDGAYAVAVAIFAFGFGGAPAVGAYVALRLTLVAVGLPFLATLIDRLPRKAFMIAADLIRVLLLGAGAAVIWLHGPPLLVLVIAGVASFVGAPFRPAQAALMPSLAATPHELTAANAVGSTLESIAFFIGPALGGLLLSVASVPAIFCLNAVSFAYSALMISGLRPPAAAAPAVGAPAEPDLDPPPAPSFLTEASAGFRIIGQDTRLRLLTILCCAQTLVTGGSMVFVVVIAVDFVRLGSAGVGYLNAVLGVGAVVGGLVAIGRSSRGRVARDFGAGVFGWSFPPLLVALWPSPVTAFLAVAIIGAANPFVDVNLMTLIQRLTPEAALGRVFGALESALIAAMALGAFVMPFLIQLLGIRWGLVVISVPSVATVLLALRALGRLDQTVSAPPYLDLVSALPLFAPLAPAVREGLASRLTTIRLAAGEVVIHEGEPGDRFYLIESGSLDAVRGPLLLSQMGPGDCFGEIALLRNVPRTATVVATQDSVVHALDREDFLTAVGAEPESSQLAEVLVNRRIVR